MSLHARLHPGLVAGVLLSLAAAAGNGAAAEPLAASSSPQSRPAIRVVPQLYYQPKGLVDPTGRFAVTRDQRIVDLRCGQVAWVLETPPFPLGFFAFSPDGQWLVIASPGGGLRLELATDRSEPLDWLKGGCPLFSPDGKLIYLAGRSRPQVPSDLRFYVDAVQVFDLQGKLIRSYGLQMNMVGKLSFSPDGKNLIVDGGTGVRLEHRGGGTFTPARQTIQLETGQSTMTASTEPSSQPYAAVEKTSFDALNFQDIPVRKKVHSQPYGEVVWDSSTASFAVGGAGRRATLWDLGQCRFIKELQHIHDLSLLRPGVLFGTAWYDKRELPPELAALAAPAQGTGPTLITLIELPGGRARPLPISTDLYGGEKRFQPSPDGRYIAAVTYPGMSDANSRLEVWDVQNFTRAAVIPKTENRVTRFQWTTGGQLIVRLLGPGSTFWAERFTPQGESEGVLRGAAVDCSFSPDGERVAVREILRGGAATTVTVRKSLTGEEIACFNWNGLAAAQFLDNDQLFTSTDNKNRLMRISDGKMLWEAKMAGGPEFSFEPGWDKLVVHSFAGTQVLSVETGQPCPADLALHWYDPSLLCGGRLALDPLCGSTILRLRDTGTGDTIITLAAFGDQEWIIYAPDGLWSGTPGALEWMAFYRGIEPLSGEEIEALHQSAVVNGRVEKALRGRAGKAK